MTTIINEIKLDYSDVLLVPDHSNIDSRSDVELKTNVFDVSGIPLIAANMDGVGTFKMAEALARHRIFTCLTKHYTIEDLVRFYTDKANADIIPFTIYSMGANYGDLEKYHQVVEKIQSQQGDLEAQTEPRMVCIDVANGYTRKFREFIEGFRDANPSTIIIAGNVCTPRITRELLHCGANFVKIGIGPGSVCTTRIVTGVGYPQFSAVLECAEAALQAGGGVIADGGCTTPGDVAKAFGAGASAVMLGGMLAGHDEGEQVELKTQYINTPVGGYVLKTPYHMVDFHGMASKKAQNLHNGGVADYRSSEGRDVKVPYRGPVDNTILHILGGLRSACAYTDSESLTELGDATFVKVNHQYNKVFE